MPRMNSAVPCPVSQEQLVGGDMDFSTVTLLAMFGLPLLAMVVIFLLARNWATRVQPPDGHQGSEETR